LISLLLVMALLPWPLLFSEQHWWAFIPATAAILGLLRLLQGSEWARIAGLKMPLTDILPAVAAFALMVVATKLILPGIYAANGLRADSPGIAQQLGLLFQSLNEEVLFRALLIGFVLHYVRSRVLISTGLAFIFAAAHFLLYRYSNPLHLALSPLALLTLFLAGLVMNNLYLAFRHIGFSWAFHAGWNIVWLPAAVTDIATNAQLHEPQVFDRVLGAPVMAATAGATALLSFALLVRPPRPLAERDAP
jgi:membrane protease YdiL (CAAX protease family)